MAQQLFNLTAPPAEDEVVEVRPNFWLLTAEEIPPLLMSPDEVARCLGIGKARVYELIRSGALRSIKFGASRRISARALSDCVAALELEDTA